MKQRKLLLAGSHAGATAVAVISEIKRLRLDWKICWVGKKWATEEKNSYTLEYNSLPKLGVTFYPLESGKIQTKFTRHTLTALLKVPLGFIRAGFYVFKIKPQAILTFGGAAGAEVSFWGFVFGIPVVVHEQTSVAGRANIFASRFAKAVAISRETSRKYFKAGNIVLTGNPINPDITLTKDSPKSIPQTLFVTGGSRGSENINEAIIGILPDLLEKYNVILQAGEGNVSKFNIDSPRFKLYGQIDTGKWASVLKSSDVVVSRAGANIVSELVALKKPCVLIPIPWVYLNEQMKNAEFAKEFGIARILHQKELSPETLKENIEAVFENYAKIITKVKSKVSQDINASRKLIDLLKKYV